MTLLVGFGQPGMNAIIADTRVSWIESDGSLQGQNDALKSGLLFSGGIYGYTGSVDGAREFIVSFKRTTQGAGDTGLLWRRFQRFAAEYSYRPDAHFRILVSHRASGVPAFALLDSATGLDVTEIPHPYFLLAFGSGKEPLVDRIRDLFSPRLQHLQQALIREQKLPVERVRQIAPYLLCLWLSELTMTFEGEWLKGHGVGGVFHFIAQGPTWEAPQLPAVYVFSAADRNRKVIRSWLYRVAPVAGGLYVEECVPPAANEGGVSRLAFFDSAARCDVAALSQQELRTIVEAELGALDSRFFFCGFGFADPGDRVS